MIYAVEAWEYPTEEEGGEHECVDVVECRTEEGAKELAWERMQEGFAVRLYLRQE